MDDFQSFARNLEVAFRASAAFRRWVADTGRNIAAILESLESRVDAANGDVVTAFRFELFGYRNAVCFVAQSNQNEHHHQFEIAQRCVSGGHIFIIYEDIAAPRQSKRGKVRGIVATTNIGSLLQRPGLTEELQARLQLDLSRRTRKSSVSVNRYRTQLAGIVIPMDVRRID